MFLPQRNDKYDKWMDIQISQKCIHEISPHILYVYAITCGWEEN